MQTNEALRYLEFCTRKLNIKDEAIHNYLLCLYAKFKRDHLMPYLRLQGQVMKPEGLFQLNCLIASFALLIFLCLKYFQIILTEMLILQKFTAIYSYVLLIRN